jgi:predicted GIY-YIG superfamily endonuclease
MNCCYLLYLPGTNRTYIGATKDPAHRLRQHNGELSGGAKATKGKQWTQAFYLSGFPDWRSTLQFEWAWKYYGRGKPGLKGKIAALHTLRTKKQATSKSRPFVEWPVPILGHFTHFQVGLVIKIDGGPALLADKYSLLPVFIVPIQATSRSQMSSKTSSKTAAVKASSSPAGAAAVARAAAAAAPAPAVASADALALIAALTARVAALELAAVGTSPTVPGKGKRGGKAAKAVKDPNAPKRPLSNYMNFCNAKRAEVKAANPDAKMTDLSKILGTQWKALSEEQQTSYKTAA